MSVHEHEDAGLCRACGELADRILSVGAPAAEAAVERIRARIMELEPLKAFGGPLGAVYAAEVQGLLYALHLLEAGA